MSKRTATDAMLPLSDQITKRRSTEDLIMRDTDQPSLWGKWTSLFGETARAVNPIPYIFGSQPQTNTTTAGRSNQPPRTIQSATAPPPILSLGRLDTRRPSIESLTTSPPSSAASSTFNFNPSAASSSQPNSQPNSRVSSSSYPNHQWRPPRANGRVSPTPTFSFKHSQPSSTRSFLTSPGRPKDSGRALVMGGGVNKHRRKHIHDKVYREGIKASMIDELYHLKQIQGYRADPETFKSYLNFKAQLEKLETADLIKASEGYPINTNVGPIQSQRPIYDFTFTKETLGSEASISRALKKAKDTLTAPRVVAPAREFEKLKLEDVAIETRLHPPKRELPPDIPPSAEGTVSSLFRKRGTIATVGKEQVSHGDLARLCPRAWLNDEIINLYGAMIAERSERWAKGDQSDTSMKLEDDGAAIATAASKSNGKAEVNGKGKGGKGKEREHGDPLKVHYFNTFFYAKLQSPGYEKARLSKWTKKVDVFAKDVLLIPINLGNSHWTFACINIRKKRIEYYDSMGHERAQVYSLLRDYLHKEFKDKKKKDFDASEWVDYFSEETPQQENAFDCGVFTCQFMESVSRGEDAVEFTFGQKDMPYLRKRMVWEIGKGRLASWKP